MSDYDDIPFGLPTAEEIKHHLLSTKSLKRTRQTIGALPSPIRDEEDSPEKCSDLSALIEDVSKLSIRSQYFTPNETFQKPTPTEEFYTPNDTLQTSIKNQEFIEKVSQILNNTETQSETHLTNDEFCEVLETSSEDNNLTNTLEDIIEKLDADIEEHSREMVNNTNLQTEIICLSDDDEHEYDGIEFTDDNKDSIKKEADLSRYACLQSKYEDISGIAENQNGCDISKHNYEEADSVVILLNTSDEMSDHSEFENCDDSGNDNLVIADMSRDSLERENHMIQHNINSLQALQVQRISNEDVENIGSPKNQHKYLLNNSVSIDMNNKSLTSQIENQTEMKDISINTDLDSSKIKTIEYENNSSKFSNVDNIDNIDSHKKDYSFLTNNPVSNYINLNESLTSEDEDQQRYLKFQNCSPNIDFDTSEITNEYEAFNLVTPQNEKICFSENLAMKNTFVTSETSISHEGSFDNDFSSEVSSLSKPQEKCPKDISQNYSMNKHSNDSFDDTISEMEKALAMGLDYSSSDEEERSNNEQTQERDIKNTSKSKSQIPRLAVTKPKPGKFDYIISPVSNYIMKTSPTQFKLPQPIINKKKTPTPLKYTSTVYNDIKSPVMMYIKNSPVTPLQQKISTNKMNINQSLFPSISPIKKPGELSLPNITYKPAKNVVNHTDKEMKLPNCIDNLIPYCPKVLKHEKRINQMKGESMVQRKLMDNNLTLNATDCSINGHDISIRITKAPLRK